MSGGQTWDTKTYRRNAAYVPVYGEALLRILQPQAGQRILDLGCGDGVLTEKLAATGASVVGLDPSPGMVRKAKARGLEVRLEAAEALNDQEAFDAVFSNAALHWVKDHPQVLKRVYRALKPGGRFVGECGGRGNVAAVVVAIMAACSEEGLDGLSLYPWRFVSASTFLGHLREAGFNASDEEVTLFSRTTPLPTGLCGWLETFAVSFLGAVPDGRRSAFLARVEELAAPALRDEDGNWHADYVRLRFQARKPG